MQSWSRPALCRLALAAALASCGGAAAHAADGVLELDPSCAAVGCFPGDAPGYPIEITQPGSYKLTGNLDVRNTPLPSDTVAIGISAAAVTLDLAGFRIVGPVVCSAPPVTCSPAATADAIVLSDDADAAVVRNGVVSGFRIGVHVLGGAIFPRLEGLVAYSNLLEGVLIGAPGAQLVGVTAFQNGRNGIQVGQAAAVRRSTSARNAHEGLVSGPDSLLVDNTVFDNGLRGVHGAGRSLYARNVISENGLEGLFDDGGGALAYGNAITNNNPFGILFGGSGSGYTENVLHGQAIAATGGLSLQQNACNGSGC